MTDHILEGEILTGPVANGEEITEILGGDLVLIDGALYAQVDAQKLDLGLDDVDINTDKDWDNNSIANLRQLGVKRLRGGITGDKALAGFEGDNLSIDTEGVLNVINLPVTSVFGRGPEVTAESGDYSHDQISGVEDGQHHDRPDEQEMSDAAPVQSVDDKTGQVTSHVEVQDGGSQVDQATTINFGSGISAAGSSGTVDVSTADPGTQSLDVQNVNDVVTDNSSASGSITLDISTSNVFRHTLTGDVSYSVTGVSSDPQGNSFILRTIQDSTGGHSITWPSGAKFHQGNPPSASANAGDEHWFSLTSLDGGSSWLVSVYAENVS